MTKRAARRAAHVLAWWQRSSRTAAGSLKIFPLAAERKKFTWAPTEFLQISYPTRQRFQPVIVETEPLQESNRVELEIEIQFSTKTS